MEDEHLILVADDDMDMRFFLTFPGQIRSKRNLKFLQAENGSEALHLARIHRPSVTVLDYMMPGLNGLDVLRKIKEEKIPTRVIIVTETRDPKFVVKALKEGAADFIAKPFDPDDFSETLERVLLTEPLIGRAMSLEATKADRLAVVSALRNELEPRLRRFVKLVLKAHLGPHQWLNPVREALSSERRSHLDGPNLSEILNRITLRELITVICKNWDPYFKPLSMIRKQEAVTLDKFRVWLEFVDNHREDAHADDISDEDLVTMQIVVPVIRKAIDAYFD